MKSHGEQNATLATIVSGDGTFRVECVCEPDDRGPPIETLRILAMPGDRVVLDLPHFGTTGLIRFPRPGVVILPLRGCYTGELHQVTVNVAAGTFTLDGDDESIEHPLEFLKAQLNPEPSSKRSLSRLNRPRRRSQIFEIVIGFLSVPFFPAGLWMSLTAKAPMDRLAGVIGVVLAVVGISNAIIELRRTREIRNHALRAAPRDSPKPHWSRFTPYLPLVAIVVEIPWLVVLLMGFLFVVGDAPYTHTPNAASTHLWDVVAALPAMVGLVFGIVCVLRARPSQILEWMSLIIGCAGCALFVSCFGREFFS